jgi:hypothetical protein
LIADRLHNDAAASAPHPQLNCLAYGAAVDYPCISAP